MAADPLAPVAHGRLSRPLARRRQSLPHAAARRCGRQSGSAHRRGHQAVHRRRGDRHRRPADRPRFAERGGDAGVIRRHPVEPVGGGPAGSVRHGLEYSGLPGMGRPVLRRVGHGIHALDRPAADRPQFPPAALRGRFSLQPGARAGEFRADRTARRRDRRTRAPDGSLWRGGRKLACHHVAHQATDVLHRRLSTGLHRIPLYCCEPRLFLRPHPARRADADRVRIRQRSAVPVVLHQRLSPAGRMAGGDRPARRLRGGDRQRPAGRAGAARRFGRRAARLEHDHDRGAHARPAYRRAVAVSERRHPRRPRPGPGDRAYRIRKIDPVPGDRRHLAVRQRQRDGAVGRPADDTAAASLLPGRLAGGRGQLSGRGGNL